MEEHHENESARSHPPPSTSANASFTLTPLAPRNRQDQEICAAEEDLPASSISQLWKQPLRFSKSNELLSCNSPSGKPPGRRTRSTLTPTRKAFASLPPTKLFSSGGGKLDITPSPGLTIKRSFYRRSLSHPEHGLHGSDTPVQPKRLKLFADETSPYEELCANNPISGTGPSASSTLTPAVKKLFVQKSQSDSQLPAVCNVTATLEKIESNPNLIGDASKPCILQVMPMKDREHKDLKEITGDVLANLLEKQEDLDPGVSFKIIDCRFPYEFDGGHIRGALNYFSRKQIAEELLDRKTALAPPSKSSVSGESGTVREILIFHCEFSSKRGPGLCRHLRQIDRDYNATSYPFLFYPELYLLHGGYKAFFEKFPHLCVPQSYVPMDHPEHKGEFKTYRSFTKTKSFIKHL